MIKYLANGNFLAFWPLFNPGSKNLALATDGPPNQKKLKTQKPHLPSRGLHKRAK
jgi:hypothetical protein